VFEVGVEEKTKLKIHGGIVSINKEQEETLGILYYVQT
jgi:hypothetical protein